MPQNLIKDQTTVSIQTMVYNYPDKMFRPPGSYPGPADNGYICMLCEEDMVFTFTYKNDTTSSEFSVVAGWSGAFGANIKAVNLISGVVSFM